MAESARDTAAYRVHGMLIHWVGQLTHDEEAAVRELLDEHTELVRLRAQLAEIGETREEFGVCVDGCTDTIGVYPGRESAEENLALWRKVWPSSEFTLMQRENRAAVVSGWREVPDA